MPIFTAPATHLPEFLIFEVWQKTLLARIETHLDVCLRRDTESDSRLGQAMRYAVMNRGKRIRALLVLASSGQFIHSFSAPFSTSANTALEVAAALEFMHAYSLVHDDLPALDNDDWRRGQPSVHKQYDEATAILVGDALQSLAIWTLARTLDSEGVQTFSRAALMMCQGQMRDLAATGSVLELHDLEQLHQQKTGALISASIALGARCTEPPLSAHALHCLEQFSSAIGLAFQIRDDILDGTASLDSLGKTIGKDQAQGKPTFVTMLGLTTAQAQLEELAQQAAAALSQFETDPLASLQHHAIAYYLRGVANFVVTRSS